MKCIITFVCLMISSSFVLCQTDSSIFIETPSRIDKEIFVSGGISYPYLPEEFNKYWDPGLNTEVGFGISFEPGEIGYSIIYGSLGMNRFEFNEQEYRNTVKKTSTDTLVSGNTTTSFTLTVNYKGSFSTSKESIAPYFVIGIGYMLFVSDNVTVNDRYAMTIEGESISTFTWSVGFGVEIPVTKTFAGYIQGSTFMGVFDRPHQYFPVSAGIRYRF